MVGSSGEEDRVMPGTQGLDASLPATKGLEHHTLGPPGLGMSLNVVKRGVTCLKGVMSDGTFMSASCFT